MSKPKIFQQMESAGSFWITDDNIDTITLQNVYNKYTANIPVFLKASIPLNSELKTYQLTYCTLANSAITVIFTTVQDGEIISIAPNSFSTTTTLRSVLNTTRATPNSKTITNKSGDTMEGSLLAKADIANSRQMRNITLSTAEPSSGENGDVWIQYEE